MAWLGLLPIVPIWPDLIARADRGEAEADLARHQQERSQLQEETRRQSEAHERRIQLIQQLQQERSKLQEELKEQPTSPLLVLRDQSRRKYNLQEGIRNVQLTGLTSAGKSYLCNVLAGIDEESNDRIEVGFFETTQEPEARVSQRAELRGLVIHDCPGTGTDSNDPGEAVKDLKPAGFDMVLIVMIYALMRADCAVIAFCHEHGIPWAIVKSKMDLAIHEAGSKEKVIQGVTAHIKHNLGLRNIPLPNDHLFFICAAQFDTGDFDENALVHRLQAIK